MPKLSVPILLALLCLMLSACAPDRGDGNTAPTAAPTAAPVAAATPATASPPADPHAQHHATAGDHKLQRPAGGGNWPTDAALRQGMQAIHVALAAALPSFEKGDITASEATALASVVTGQVQFLLANCKLEPDADGQLHILIGEMLTAAEAMVSDAASTEGVPKLLAAVQLYGEYFEHPGLHDNQR